MTGAEWQTFQEAVVVIYAPVLLWMAAAVVVLGIGLAIADITARFLSHLMDLI